MRNTEMKMPCGKRRAECAIRSGSKCRRDGIIISQYETHYKIRVSKAIPGQDHSRPGPSFFYLIYSPVPMSVVEFMHRQSVTRMPLMMPPMYGFRVRL